MMPDIDGFSYCKKIRSLVDCPILFLTAKTMEHDITYGLGLGADDYLTNRSALQSLGHGSTPICARTQGTSYHLYL